MISRLFSFILCLGLGFAVTAWPQRVGRVWGWLFPPAVVAVPLAEKAPPAPSQSAPAGPSPLASRLRDTVTMPPGTARAAAMKEHEKALAALDPEAALRRLLTLPPTLARDAMLRAAFPRLITADVAKAVAWAERVPMLARTFGDEIVKQLAGLVTRDGPSAWALFERLLVLVATSDGSMIVEAWASVRPEEAAQFGMALPRAATRTEFMRRLLKRWAIGRTEGFVAWMRHQSPDAVLPYLTEFRWEVEDLPWQKLLQLASVLPPHLLGDVVWSGWAAAAKDEPGFLATAAETIRQFPPGDARDGAMAGFIEALAAKDPVAAQAYLAEIQRPAPHAAAAAQIAARLAATDPAAALAFAESQTDTLSREAGLRSALGTWINKQPKEGSAYLQALLGAGDLTPAALGDLAPLWASQDPAGMATFALTQATAEQCDMVARAVSNMAYADSAAFLSILRAAVQRPGGVAAWESIAKSMSFWDDPDPASRSPMVALLPPGPTKQRAASEILPDWRGKDPAAANQWYQAQLATGGLEPLPELSVTGLGRLDPTDPTDPFAAPPPPPTLGLEIFTYTGNGLSLTGYY